MFDKRMSIVQTNHLLSSDRAIHDWYRFVLAFPPHFVRTYLEKLSACPGEHVLLDPFCGTGTTLVEAQKAGFKAYGIDGNQIAVFSSRVKTTWDLDLAECRKSLDAVLFTAADSLNKNGHALYENGNRPLLSPSQYALIPSGFISDEPLRKVLALKSSIKAVLAPSSRDLFTLALADVIVTAAGNLAFGPEVYRTKPKADAAVLESFSLKVRRMIDDLEEFRLLDHNKASVMLDDARELSVIPPQSVDIVVTSPPYPNEKDYTRTTRLESVLLDFLVDKADLRRLKERLLRSNTRNVFKGDSDWELVTKFDNISRIAFEIEKRRLELNKTSGFEKLYHKVVLLYFGGMYRHFRSLWDKLKPGARCAYVVGDQMSFLLVPIRTASILAEILEELGYRVLGIELWRTRRATATRIDLREEVLLFEKPFR
ncbi:MAG TPA: DNA methyltransferase [Dehalococcoidia bacterium]|nr:DNA methyltransferase [Dehalococcoidia bacterium]